MTTQTSTRIRVPARMAFFLEGTQEAADRTAGRASTDPIRTVMDAIAATPPRKDGSRVVSLDNEGRAALRNYASYFEVAAADEAGIDPDCRADLNAARAVLKQLA